MHCRLVMVLRVSTCDACGSLTLVVAVMVALWLSALVLLPSRDEQAV
jgi:hypothetical protein